MVSFRRLLVFGTILLAGSDLLAQRRKNKNDVEPPTQVLAPLPEPPDALTVETAKLSFQLSPLSAKGLLSQQVRDALKALAKDNRGATIVKLRAFVAGSGDLRRVQAIVAEEFSERKVALPVISTVQVGGLPIVGAQVVLEATSMERRPVNPNGLAFISGQTANDVNTAVEALKAAASGVETLRVTCFLNSLDDVNSARTAVAAAFPASTANFVQSQRQSVESTHTCEAVGRLSAGTAPSVTPRIAAINAPKIVLTGAKLVFRDQDSDVQLTFQRLGKSLEAVHASMKDVFWTGIFSLSRPMTAKIASQQPPFLDPSIPRAGTALIAEGLPSTDATASIEVIATVN